MCGHHSYYYFHIIICRTALAHRLGGLMVRRPPRKRPIGDRIPLFNVGIFPHRVIPLTLTGRWGWKETWLCDHGYWRYAPSRSDNDAHLSSTSPLSIWYFRPHSHHPILPPRPIRSPLLTLLLQRTSCSYQEGCSAVDSSPLWDKRTSLQKRVPEENSMPTMSASVKRRLSSER